METSVCKKIMARLNRRHGLQHNIPVVQNYCATSWKSRALTTNKDVTQRDAVQIFFSLKPVLTHHH